MIEFFRGLWLLMLIVSLSSTAQAEVRERPFFLMGDGRVHIKNVHTGKEAAVSLLNPDGSLSEKGFKEIDRVFGFPTAEKGEHISPRLIFMLDYFSDRLAPGKVIKMESGYRSPQYNASLRGAGGNVASTSTHMDGVALDFSIDGVSGKKMWELIKSKDCCGVGHYGGSSVHLDSARPRFWEAATSKVRTRESEYNRRIYLSTDFDRYRLSDTVRLSLSSVSDFGFGINPNVRLVEGSQGAKKVFPARLKTGEDSDCATIADRRSSHFIYLPLPQDVRPGKYRIEVDFCSRPFEQMPAGTASNEIELLGSGS